MMTSMTKPTTGNVEDSSKGQLPARGLAGHVQTLETATATITFSGAAQGDSDSEESEEEYAGTTNNHLNTSVNQRPDMASNLPGRSMNNKEVAQVNNSPDEKTLPGEMSESEKKQANTSTVTTTGQAPKQRSPVRFNPFDRDDYREDIKNVFPHLRKTAPVVSTTAAHAGHGTESRDERLASVSSDGWLDATEDNHVQPCTDMAEEGFGIAEDHFSEPDGLDCTSLEELKMAIEDYKQRVLESKAHSETRRQLVQTLVELRMRLAEAKDEVPEEDPDSKHVVGHNFVKRDDTSGRRFCEKCNGVIWGMLQNWYRCSGCGFCCHTKCLNLITRTCASLRVVENPQYILVICLERGLASQNYRCVECKAPISFQNGYGEPRQCDYTGAYYCELCHWNDTMIIPARVLRNWDFEPRKVCRASKQFLKLMCRKSVLRIPDTNPMLFNFVEELNEVKKLREEILIMKRYFLSCKAALDSKLLLQLRNRQHFVENSDMYSLWDLEDVVSDTLLPQLAKIHASFAQHIKTDCQLCKGKGYVCELCDYEEVLFPFDNHAIVCSQCSTVLHRHCYMRRQQRCPKCERIEKRTGEVQDLSELIGHGVTLQT